MNFIISTVEHSIELAKEVFGSDSAVEPYLGKLSGYIRPGDKVIGNLPVHAAARVTDKGAEYWHLEVPGGFRGKEWTLASLRKNAKFIRYTITRGEER